MTSALLLAALLQAVQATPPAPTKTPDWAKRPTGTPSYARRLTGEEVARYFPAAAREAGVSGRVTLRCTATAAGELAPCAVESENPTGHGFGAAALQMSTLVRLKPLMSDGSSVAGVQFVLPILFDAREDEPIARPVWVKRPDAKNFARYYPQGAKRRGVNGRAVIQCTVAPSGDLGRCTVLEETPAGAGFGEAALKLSRLFRMANTDEYGIATAGGTVRVPITFMVGGR